MNKWRRVRRLGRIRTGIQLARHDMGDWAIRGWALNTDKESALVVAAFIHERQNQRKTGS